MHRQGITDPAFHTRFWARVRQSDGCWLWTGCRVRGYGMTKCDGRGQLAHRVAWQLTHGPIPDGMDVCHTCDEPACCRTSHLWLGTHKDNMRDMTAKGRASDGRGVRNPAAKLTEAEVRQIRQRYADGGISHRKLGSAFGVSESTIQHLIIGRKWAHIT